MTQAVGSVGGVPRILVAFDHPCDPTAALKLAVEVARSRRGTVDLVGRLPGRQMLLALAAASGTERPEVLRQDEARELDTHLRELAEKVPGEVAVRRWGLVGEERHSLEKLAAQEHYDLIVVVRRRRFFHWPRSATRACDQQANLLVDFRSP